MKVLHALPILGCAAARVPAKSVLAKLVCQQTLSQNPEQDDACREHREALHRLGGPPAGQLSPGDLCCLPHAAGRALLPGAPASLVRLQVRTPALGHSELLSIQPLFIHPLLDDTMCVQQLLQRPLAGLQLLSLRKLKRLKMHASDGNV